MSLLLLFAGTGHQGTRTAGTVGKIKSRAKYYDPRELEKELEQRRKETFSRKRFDEILAEREAELQAQLRAAELQRDLERQAEIDAKIAAVEALKAQLLAPRPTFIAAKPLTIELRHLIDSQVITRAKQDAEDEDEAIALMLLH